MKYSELNDLLAQLQSMVEETNPQKGYWRELWALSKAIGTGFKETRHPTLADKNEAWEQFRQLREKAKLRGVSEQHASPTSGGFLPSGFFGES